MADQRSHRRIARASQALGKRSVAPTSRDGDGVLRVARYTLFEVVLPREPDEAHGDTAYARRIRERLIVARAAQQGSTLIRSALRKHLVEIGDRTSKSIVQRHARFPH
jgi:hypothetical protein